MSSNEPVKLWVLITVIFVGVCVGVWWSHKTALPPPPVELTWRPSAISGLVMQVHNVSRNNLSCALVVVNSTQGQHQNYSFSLEPYGQKEIGVLEARWSFEHGEWGNIRVEGYAKQEFTVP